jgi:hypothetical protein
MTEAASNREVECELHPNNPAVPIPISIRKARPMPTTPTDPTVLDKPSRYRTPPGQRVIHVLVPEETFVHVHKMALESGMRFTHYLCRFLEEAFPYAPSSAHADASRTRA